MELLQTRRLVLRPFSREDASDLHDYLSRSEVYRFEPGEPLTLAECLLLAEERAESKEFLAVCLKDNGKMIGHLYFQHIEPLEYDTWEIGYIFNPDYGKKGYATESTRTLVDWLFKSQGAHRVMAQCDPDNPASWRLLERLGMRREGVFHKRAFFKRDEEGLPIWHDACVYAVLEENWNVDFLHQKEAECAVT